MFRTLLLIVVVFLSLLTISSMACAQPTPAPLPTPTPAPAPYVPKDGTPLAPTTGEPEPPAPPPQVEVFINESAFEPALYNARVGSTIVWYNNASVEHTVTSRDNLFDSGNISPGDTFRFTVTPEVKETLEQSGTSELEYYCKIHPSMVGKITIE